MNFKKLIKSLKEKVKAQKKTLAWVRITILVIATVVSALVSIDSLNNIRQNYQSSSAEDIEEEGQIISGKLRPDSTFVINIQEMKGMKQNSTLVAAQYMQQSQEFSSWAVLLLAGVIGLVTTIKVHQAPGIHWTFVLFGPGSVFLTVSMYTGWVLHKRYTYLIGKNQFNEKTIASMRDLLNHQGDLFFDAIYCVSIFAAILLVLIVFGKVKPYET